MPSNKHKPRKDKRQPLALPVECRSSLGGAADGEIHDLSEHGCRIDLSRGQLSAGQAVALRQEPLEAIAGMVRWTEGSALGIEFQHPLHFAVVNHLAANNPSPAASQKLGPVGVTPSAGPGFTDRFGRPLARMIRFRDAKPEG